MFKSIESYKWEQSLADCAAEWWTLPGRTDNISDSSDLSLADSGNLNNENIKYLPWVTTLLAAVSSQQWTFIIWNYNSSIFRLCVRDGSCFPFIQGTGVSQYHWRDCCFRPSSVVEMLLGRTMPVLSLTLSLSFLTLQARAEVPTEGNDTLCTTCNVPPLPPITIYSEWSLKLYLISLLTCNLIPTHWIGALLVSRISLTRRSDNSRKISIEVCLCDPWCSLRTETAIYRQVKWRRWRLVNIFVKSTDLHNW